MTSVTYENLFSAKASNNDSAYATPTPTPPPPPPVIVSRNPHDWQQKSTAEERPTPELIPSLEAPELGDEGDGLFPSGVLDDADDFNVLEPLVPVAQVEDHNEMRGTDYHTMRTLNEEKRAESTQPDETVNTNIANEL